jgi:hypothetical protein
MMSIVGIRWFPSLLIGLLFIGIDFLAAADNQLVVTVDADVSASAAFSIMNDTCTIHLSARIVYVPDSVTGKIKPSDEQYTLTAKGGGAIGSIESWSYSNLQPRPGTVSMSIDLGKGQATVGWKYLTDMVVSTPPGEGSTRMALVACKMAEENYEMKPDSGEATFTPNAAQFFATGHGEGSYSDLFSTAKFIANYTIQMGVADWEAVIIPDPNLLSPAPKYADWIPTGSQKEDVPGNSHTAKVILRRKGSTQLVGDPLARARFTFHLNDTSPQPGVCMNYPSAQEAQDSPDLKFTDSESLTLSDEGQTAETKRNDLNDCLITLQSFDYGAYGRLTVDADVGGVLVRAFVQDHPEQSALTFPKDDNGNHIAEAWEDQQFGLPSNPPATWDESPSPDGQFRKGDGISLYEKYRVFIFSGIHERLNPMRKHLFVYDESGCVRKLTLPGNIGSSFSQASGGIELRFVDDDTWTGPGAYADKKRIVNFNTNDFGHAVDQHALHVRLQSANDPKVPDEFLKMFRSKYTNDPSADPRGSFGVAWPDVTSPGAPTTDSPKDTLVIEAYTAEMDDYTDRTVVYNLWTAALLQKFYATTTSLAEKQKIWNDVQTARKAAMANVTSLSQRQWYHLSAVLCHELGHGIGVDELNAPSTGGPWSCLMRYLGMGDFTPDPSDVFEFKRRWTAPNRPAVFCKDATATKRNLGCYAQIQVTDRDSGGAASAAMASHQSTPPSVAAASVPPVIPANPSTIVLKTNLSALAVTTRLAWMPVQAGDPLRLTVSLTAPNWLQTQDKALLQGATSDLVSPRQSSTPDGGRA